MGEEGRGGDPFSSWINTKRLKIEASIFPTNFCKKTYSNKNGNTREGIDDFVRASCTTAEN